MVRSTNTGLSGVVKATGETQLISPPYEEAYRVVEVSVPLVKRWTLYSAIGEWFALLCLAFSTAIGAWLWTRQDAPV